MGPDGVDAAREWWEGHAGAGPGLPDGTWAAIREYVAGLREATGGRLSGAPEGSITELDADTRAATVRPHCSFDPLANI